jgi:hypothetical protein
VFRDRYQHLVSETKLSHFVSEPCLQHDKLGRKASIVLDDREVFCCISCFHPQSERLFFIDELFVLHSKLDVVSAQSGELLGFKLNLASVVVGFAYRPSALKLFISGAASSFWFFAAARSSSKEQPHKKHIFEDRPTAV